MRIRKTVSPVKGYGQENVYGFLPPPCCAILVQTGMQGEVCPLAGSGGDSGRCAPEMPAQTCLLHFLTALSLPHCVMAVSYCIIKTYPTITGVS